MSILIIVTSEENRKKLLEKIAYEYVLHEEKFVIAKSKVVIDPYKNHIVTDALLRSQRYEYFCVARRFQLKFGVIIDSDEAEPAGKYDKEVGDICNFLPKKSISNQKRNTKGDFLCELKKKIDKLNDKYNISDDVENIFMRIASVAQNIDDLEELYKEMILGENKKL